MIRTKKVFSALLVIAILVSTVVVSSLSAKGAETILAYKFKQSCWMQNQFMQTKPTLLESDKNGFRVMSDHIQRQYQMLFEVDETNAENLANAIQQANDYYNGNLYLSITVNSAINIRGTNCSPEIRVSLCSNTNSESGVLVQKSQQIMPGATVPKFKLDVSDFDNEDKYPQGYQNQIKYIYVLVQCYDWSCDKWENGQSVGGGTQPDVHFGNIFVDDGQEASTVPVSTKKVDPNQLTFNSFSPLGFQSQKFDPDTIKYSADCATWKGAGKATEADYGFARLSQPNAVEQMQASYKMTSSDITRQAIANANAEGGTHKIKVDLNLASCLDPDDEPVIAEIVLSLTGTIGNGDKEPDTQMVKAWQYPGTTRTYYFDVSGFKNDTQVKSFDILVQNYWYYNPSHQIQDWDQLTNYAGEQAAYDAGWTKCRIHGIDAILSPITVEKDNPNVTNTPYAFSLDGYNKEGKMPADLTSGDPNVEGGSAGETTVTTTQGGGGSSSVAAPAINSAKLTGKTEATVNYKASANADSYTIYRSTSAKGTYTAIKSGVKTLSYTDKTVKGGKTYYYKVKAVKGSATSAFSGYKAVKVMNYSGKPTLKLTAAKKALTVKVKKKVKNATSYQVWYATNKKFSGKKTATFKSSKKLSKLKKSTKYFVKARAVTKVGSKKYYSKWSKVLNIKTK